MSLICTYCNKEFKNSGARALHEKRCSSNPQRFVPQKYNCTFCNKVCTGIDGLHNHENHCKLNPVNAKCKAESSESLNCLYCNKEFKNKGLKTAHEKICSKNPDRVYYDYRNRYDSISEEHKNNMAWSRGKTKDTDERVLKNSTNVKKFYETHPGPFTGKHHSDHVKGQIGKNVSVSLKTGYASGTITPACGIGRGKYSYIVTPSHKYMLRSTYEFIFALYLIHIKHVEFELEAIRVPAITPNTYAETFIADFCIGDTVIEIKGIPSNKDNYIKESFTAAGYNFIELFEDSIQDMKRQLSDSGIDVESLLQKIEEGHNSKEYFVYSVVN